ncbi:MAG: ABC transporter ATP-binding protein [Acidobacteria bacterium]|nr:ABC transporter ATP-binding protein [Acidobacteriota bacterium]
MSALEVAGARGAAVRLTSLQRRYGSSFALADVDLEVEPGRFLVLLGPSGSGKSTLLRAVAGIDRIDDGEIAIDGKVVSGPRLHVPPEGRGLAMVFQDYALWPHMTVAQNVGFALRRSRRDDARVGATLDRVGLGDKAGAFPDELSGGQQQRVALARALVGEPRLVLFDEPLSNLDAHLRERMRIEIATLTRESGATAIYITHDQAEAFALADEIVVLDRGRVRQRGAPEQIYRDPASAFVARFTGLSATMRGRLRALDGRVATVEVAGGAVQATCTMPVARGAEVELLVRPAAVRLCVEGPAAIRGAVVDVAYRGGAYDHVVDTELGRFASVGASTPLQRGARCHLVVEPEGAFAFAL